MGSNGIYMMSVSKQNNNMVRKIIVYLQFFNGLSQCLSLIAIVESAEFSARRMVVTHAVYVEIKINRRHEYLASPSALAQSKGT